MRRQNADLVSLRWGREMRACRASELQVVSPVLLLLLARQKASPVREVSFTLSFISQGMHLGVRVLSQSGLPTAV